MATTLASDAVLVAGSARSGTTWLAKIFDSHPDVIYRHEPDEVLPPNPNLHAGEQLRLWIGERRPRVAARRPFFNKSWMPVPIRWTRVGIACALSGAKRLPVAGEALNRLPVPDFLSVGWNARPRAVIKMVNWDASKAARAVPGCRCLFIMRHPCGQVASILNGVRTGAFREHESGSSLPVDLSAAASHAASYGVGRMTFDALPDAAKTAWTWLAFNETLFAALDGLPNARIVLYEDLCRRPETVARMLFAFAGLAWSGQTESFIAGSSMHAGESGYYDVFRNSSEAAERWRSTLSPADQAAVRNVVRHSPLARHWPDIAQAA